MSTPAEDRYREWDAAYVLGALSPAEHQEYEQHLALCPECAAAVSSLTDLTGALATVPPQRAFALLEEPEPVGAPSQLPQLMHRADRQRRRSRLRAVALTAAAAVVAAVVSLAVPWSDFFGGGAPARTGFVAMQKVADSPVTAEAKLVAANWGTRVEGVCRYPQRPGGAGKSWEYAMFVTDTHGYETQVATWTAGPGSVVPFSAATKLPRDQIASYDIRKIGDDPKVLLRGTP